MSEKKEQILKIRDLDITFRTTAGKVHAIRGVNIDLMKGETVAIVGESGSGKSVTMKAAMGILASNATVTNGSIEFSYHHADGTPETVDILKKDKKWIRRHINGKRIALVFQDPMTSLDPTMTIGKQIMEGMIWHFKTPKKEAWDKAVALLEEVGIEDAPKRMKNYPHQLSGGMRQRVVIAIALACNPDLLICDEPTTALDVTIQAKIIELIRRVQKERGISVIYITHDLGVVAKVADYVNVMYAGKIVEKGTINDIFYDPKHPYTWGLLSAMPDLDTADERLYTIPGSPPNLLNEKPGDAFAPRNKYALEVDEKADPPMFQVTETHYAATWLLDPRAPKAEMPPELKERIERMKKEAKLRIANSLATISSSLRLTSLFIRRMPSSQAFSSSLIKSMKTTTGSGHSSLVSKPASVLGSSSTVSVSVRRITFLGTRILHLISSRKGIPSSTIWSRLPKRWASNLSSVCSEAATATRTTRTRIITICCIRRTHA